ncbi:MAG: ABC transporter permease [Acidovorax sp.]|jgi:putative spermidine/putrescine transport system permease protein|nr:ABC transporter permease [Acidovorax sp.]
MRSAAEQSFSGGLTSVKEGVDPALRRSLRRAEWRRKLKAWALIAPMVIFLTLVFILPISMLMWRAIDNPEVRQSLPQTAAVLADWDGKGLPEEAAFAALAADLQTTSAADRIGNLARRLNSERSGFRSLITKSAKALPFQGEARQALLAVDPRWGELVYWQAIARNTGRFTPVYVLAALDHVQDAQGHIVKADPASAIYLDIFGRTLWMGGVSTVLCLLLVFPLAYWASTLPERQAHLVMICVLIPFWTSVLARIAAWMVLLQQGGLVNSGLMAVGLTHAPLPLLFNRTGVYISMVHIMLPFMILPLYSVMRSVPASYMRAAISLGSHPFAAFWRVYVPQTYAGVGAGCLLVFITAIGYYITPALLGGPGDQMVSYYIAYFTNQVINWGMACALGLLLLLATLVLYALYQRMARPNASVSRR